MWWKSGRSALAPVVVDVWIAADAVLKTDVQVIPETAMQHHVPHHTKPVLQLQKETYKPSQNKQSMSSLTHSNICIQIKWKIGEPDGANTYNLLRMGKLQVLFQSLK